MQASNRFTKMKTLVLLFIFSVAYISSSSIPEEEIERKPGYCRMYGVDVQEGERISAPVGKCHHSRCKNATLNFYSSLTCSLYQLQPNSPCHISDKDLTRQYPDCCPKTICPEDYIEGQCYYQKINIKEGETVSAPIGECQGVNCIDGVENKYAVESCPISAAGPNCKYSETDLSKPWPQCCPQAVC